MVHSYGGFSQTCVLKKKEKLEKAYSFTPPSVMPAMMYLERRR